VTRRITIRHLVVVLAWLGMVFAPLASPSNAMATSMEMAAAHTETTAISMPEGMPCCPDTPDQSDCAKNCALMAICAGTVFPAMVAGGWAISFAETTSAVILPSNAPKLSGLAQGPPPRPPKA
jgi:hypothetical protein